MNTLDNFIKTLDEQEMVFDYEEWEPYGTLDEDGE